MFDNRKVALLLAVALLFGPSSFAQEGEKGAGPFARAAELIEQGKHKAALKLYDELVQVDSLRVEALALRGELKFRFLGRNEEGFADVQEALRIGPRNTEALLVRGSIYLDLGMPARAMEDGALALETATTAKDSSSAHFVMGLAHMSTNRFEQALEDFKFCLARDSTSIPARMNTATILDGLGRTEEALAIMEKVHEEMPNESSVMTNIGFILLSVERYDEAIGWFNKCLKANPKDALSLNNRGYAKLMKGDRDGALKDVDRSIKLLPGNSYAYRNLGLVHQAMGNMDAACTAWEEALQRGFSQKYGPEVKELHQAHCH